ncbi:MAG: 50S ribosomal protein L18 [Pacificimonas sp.]|jgi:large subunit ribosomal protein L18|nr:50S ribosomal protein L18 [Pacificimonas sp.]
MKEKLTPFMRRRRRVRSTLRAHASGKPRLSIHRTSKHIYAQIIDDGAGQTIAAASTLEKDVKAAKDSGGGATVSAAEAVGKRIAERAKKAGVEKVVFDRGGFIFHGRVKALADAARDGGLEF